MKKLLVLLFILLSFSLFADDKVILVSLEQESSEASDEGIDTEAGKTGFGVTLFNFADSGLYYGLKFAHLSGESDICVSSECESFDSSATLFTGEVGRDLGQWTPFIGATYYGTEIEEFGDRGSDETWSFNAGLWLELETVKLRASLDSLDDSDGRSITGGLLFQMDNNLAIGAQVGMLLNDEADGFRISLQFGRSF